MSDSLGEVRAWLDAKIADALPRPASPRTIDEYADQIAETFDVRAEPITDEDRRRQRLRFKVTVPVYVFECSLDTEADGSEAPPCRP